MTLPYHRSFIALPDVQWCLLSDFRRMESGVHLDGTDGGSALSVV